MRPALRRRAVLRLLAGVIAAVMLFGAARSLSLQWDITDDRVFTLSDSTRSVLGSLGEPLLIRAFLSPDLPQPYAYLRRYLQDILGAYHDAGHGVVGIEIVDPEADETVAASLEAMGIPRLQLQVIKDDRAEIRQAYLAVVAEYLDKREILPVIDSDIGFEYRLTTAIKNLLGFVRPKIGVVQGAGAMEWERLENLRSLLQDDYELIPVFPENEPIPVYIKALVVPGLTRPPSERMRYAIDQFLLGGKPAVVFAANGAIDDSRAGVHLKPVAEGAHDWLQPYGMVVKPGVVMDTVSGRIALDQRQRLQSFRNMVDYPFMVKVLQLQDHPAAKGLKSVMMPFAAPLERRDPATVLMKSSHQAAIQPGPEFELDPLIPMRQRFSGLMSGQWDLALVRDGSMGSAFSMRPAGMEDMPAAHLASTDGVRLMLVGSRAMLDNDFVAGENAWFLINSMDWLVGNEALIALRTRGLTQRPLPLLSTEARNTWKALWMFAMPGLVILAGLGRWAWLRRRRGAWQDA